MSRVLERGISRGMKLKDKIAIITGAGQGIGRAIAIAFANEGASLILGGRSLNKVSEVSKAISSQGVRCVPIQVDVTVKNDVSKMVEKALKEFGRIDILVNNAGILTAGWVVDMDETQWDETMNINLKGVFLCCQLIGRIMMNQSGGKILNVSSNAAVVPRIRDAAYCASKAGVLQFSRVLALELASHNINVNVLCPGSTDTDLIRDINKEKILAGDLKEFRIGIPLGRLATVEDHSKMAVFLCSEDSNNITGQIFIVDGGQALC